VVGEATLRARDAQSLVRDRLHLVPRESMNGVAFGHRPITFLACYTESMNLSEDLNLVRRLAREAGRIVRELYGKTDRLTKTHAAAKDEAVTEADRAVAVG
jgi:hypothetical protein